VAGRVVPDQDDGQGRSVREMSQLDRNVVEQVLCVVMSVDDLGRHGTSL
jgi:hypothetical protein